MKENFKLVLLSGILICTAITAYFIRSLVMDFTYYADDITEEEMLKLEQK